MTSRKLSTCVLTLNLLFGLNFPSQGQSYSQTHSIFKDKLDSSTYHTKVRPLLDQSKVMEVDVYFELLSIVEINDVAQSFTVNGFLVTVWKDELVAMKYIEEELKFFAKQPNVSQTYFTPHGEWSIEATKLNIGSLKLEI